MALNGEFSEPFYFFVMSESCISISKREISFLLPHTDQRTFSLQSVGLQDSRLWLQLFSPPWLKETMEILSLHVSSLLLPVTTRKVKPEMVHGDVLSSVVSHPASGVTVTAGTRLIVFNQ